MRVYLKPPQPSRGLERIATALRRYAPPDVEVVSAQAEADLVILYAIGRCEALLREADAIWSRVRKYAVIQVCLRSTQKPHTSNWLPLWDKATVIWSYYDLRRAMEEDSIYYRLNDNFYHAPLGADASVFYPRGANQFGYYIIATSGLSRLSESVRECILAAKQVDWYVLHIGAWMKGTEDCLVDVDDEELACGYSNCHFVSGLRRTEGFELPAIEGLLCGARPIVFNTPDYKWNYGDHAEYIQETDRQGVVEQLVQLFRRGARPVTEEELQRARQRYNWETIIDGFWQRALA